jgi:hypothetical protein
LSTISLRPLSDADSVTLLRQRPVAQQIPDEIAGEILARAEGNPFFTEQLAFHLAHDPGNPLPDALCVPQPDEMLRALLIDAIGECARWACRDADRATPCDSAAWAAACALTGAVAAR